VTTHRPKEIVPTQWQWLYKPDLTARYNCSETRACSVVYLKTTNMATARTWRFVFFMIKLGIIVVFVVCSYSELTSKIMNICIHFGRTPWMGDRPIARPLTAPGRTTQKDEDFRASSGIRFHDSIVWSIQNIHPLDQATTEISTEHNCRAIFNL
jgi:hypothetical protein